MSANGVFCLEGEWSADLRSRDSVLPMLELLERLAQIKFIHRDVATVTEVQRYLRIWKQKRYSDYRVLYLAAHGDKGSITWSSRNRSGLDELAIALRDTAADRYIYFGSCLTLFNSDEVMRFARATGARGVLGYRREVNWLESAAFDILLLPEIANHSGRPSTVFKRVAKRHGELARHLKFVLSTSTHVLRAQD
ncbi:hypothetical protein BCF74_13413 [Knoellia remsis]|uniref:CHAT domain-containing protein n=1 Tax=Knoellia remsis TaxID=407159 RepID=A0A2T0U2T8_9MICO|nr:DUF6642 family protein [Knoellia remsis]PRY52234.1 hypothetical protein BCF74_13413 [Knoellia remsis]